MIAAGLVLIVVLVAVFFLAQKNPTNAVPVTITVWGTDPSSAWKPIISGYEALRPNATVKYTQVAAGNYDSTLLTALAAGTGPDVFLIGNHDVISDSALISPAPVTQIAPTAIQSEFPEAVAQDFVYNGQVDAMPLYGHARAGLQQADVRPGRHRGTSVTWQDVLNLIPQLRMQDVNGQITQSTHFRDRL